MYVRALLKFQIMWKLQFNKYSDKQFVILENEYRNRIPNRGKLIPF